MSCDPAYSSTGPCAWGQPPQRRRSCWPSEELNPENLEPYLEELAAANQRRYSNESSRSVANSCSSDPSSGESGESTDTNESVDEFGSPTRRNGFHSPDLVGAYHHDNPIPNQPCPFPGPHTQNENPLRQYVPTKQQVCF
ncbi:hypothetical protein QR680_003679 [Steinernema hermaphroditum]|uniref:Uncharacterized protein n=1 Tax=Steinernema hermaphroditum TaxID=289476 RepID=A0AA39HL68_9BILA|nr:hypothetical protein QR680_003679 [Steinernema hermaphroditum]